MFQERNQRSRYRNDLTRSNVHVLNACRLSENGFALFPAGDQIIRKATFFIQRRVSLGNNVVTFFNRRQILNIVCDLAINNLAISCFDKAIVIYPGKQRQRVDQTNVWTFWCFNWANSTVMRRVYVTYLKAGTLTGQTAGAKG